MVANFFSKQPKFERNFNASNPCTHTFDNQDRVTCNTMLDMKFTLILLKATSMIEPDD